jgi:opacity protein-like surface antigen
MKKYLLGTVAFMVLVGAGDASAADMPVKAPPPVVGCARSNIDIVKSDRQVSLDFVENYIKYGPEVITPGTPGFPPSSTGVPLDLEKGWVPGGSVSAYYMWNWGTACNLYVMGRFTYEHGNTTYVGALQGNPFGSLVQQDGATVEDFDFRLGKGFDVGTNAMLTPYLGIGTNWWKRLLTGASGYQEVYSHDYVGAGLLFQISPIPHLVLSANGLVGGAFNSSMTTSLTPGGFLIIPATYTLGNKAVYMVGGSVDFAFTAHLHGNIGIDYTRFAYGQSALNPASGALEPNSTTRYTTVSAGLGWGF